MCALAEQRCSNQSSGGAPCADLSNQWLVDRTETKGAAGGGPFCRQDARATACDEMGSDRVFEQGLLERSSRFEEEHKHRAPLRSRRRVTAALGPNDEIAGGTFAFIIDQ